jgi:hypothetical protein
MAAGRMRGRWIYWLGNVTEDGQGQVTASILKNASRDDGG